jgi:hypothetical protein
MKTKKNTLSRIALLASVAGLSQAGTIIDSTSLNGSFESMTSTSFIPTIWGFGPNAGRIQVTNNNNSDGVRSATMGRDPSGIIFGAVQNTGHTVALGETFDLTFDWLAGPNWDNDDKILYRLFTTSDNTAAGTITEFASGSVSGQVGPEVVANYNNESFTGLTPAGANIGQQLWIEFWADTNGGLQEFARLDNVTLSAIPEPSSALVGGLGMLLLLRRRR